MAACDTVCTDWQVNYPEIKMRSAHLLRSREWADCAFVFETGAGDAAPSLEAHRLILAMASPVFAAMFYGHVGDKERPVNISDIDQPIFSSMLDYIYTDEVEITSTEFASDLFRAANKYILVHLERKCIDYLLDKLCPQNVCHIYELSCMLNEDELMQKCVEMFKTKTLDILKASSFKDAQVETLRKIYSLDTLNIDSELDLFEALVEYTKKPQFNDDNDDAVSASGSQEDNKDLCEVSQQATNDGNTNKKSTDTADLNTQDCESADIVKKRIIAARQNISGLIEKIRFLTLTALELTECRNLSSLLTESEILAIMLKLSTVRPLLYKMPEGFSTSEKSRSPVNKSRTSVTIEIKNISTFETPGNNYWIADCPTTLYSKIIYVHDLPWECRIFVSRCRDNMFKLRNDRKEDNVDEKSVMVVLVKCLLKGVLRSTTWTCSSSCEVEIIPSNLNSSNDIELKKSSKVTKSIRNPSMPSFSFGGSSDHTLRFPWKITDPSLGIVGDDTIKLKINLNVTEDVLHRS